MTHFKKDTLHLFLSALGTEDAGLEEDIIAGAGSYDGDPGEYLATKLEEKGLWITVDWKAGYDDVLYALNSLSGVQIEADEMEESGDYTADGILGYLLGPLEEETNETIVCIDTHSDNCSFGLVAKNRVKELVEAGKLMGITMEQVKQSYRPFSKLWVGHDKSGQNTYRGYKVNQLPPSGDFLSDDFSWLEKYGCYDQEYISTYDSECDAEEWTGLLETLKKDTEQAGLVLPQPFVTLMSDKKRREYIRSATACFFMVGSLVELHDRKGEYLTCFYSDSQGCVFWYLHFDTGGNTRILQSPVFFEPDYDLSEIYDPDDTDDPDELSTWSILSECAPDFTTFIYWTWMENEIWFKQSGNIPLSALEEEFLEYQQDDEDEDDDDDDDDETDYPDYASEDIGTLKARLDENPGDITVLWHIANKQMMAGMTDELPQTLLRALGVEPGNSSISALLERLHKELGNEKARDILEQLEKEFPHHKDVIKQLGCVCYFLSEYSSAGRLFERSMKIGRPNGIDFINLGAAYSMTGQYEKAIETLQQALDLEYCDEKHIVWYNLGLCLKDVHRFGDAAEAFRNVVTISPAYADGWYELGKVYWETDELDHAEDALLKALQRRPDDSDTHALIGKVYAEMGRHEDSINSFIEAIRIDPSNPDCYVKMSNAYKSQGHTDEALACLRKGIEAAPGNPELWFNTAVILDDMEQYPQAINAYQEAIRRKPDYHKAYNNLSYCFNTLGNHLEALEAANKSIGIKADYANGYFRRGVALADLKRTREAREAYLYAIRLAEEQGLDSLVKATNTMIGLLPPDNKKSVWGRLFN